MTPNSINLQKHFDRVLCRYIRNLYKLVIRAQKSIRPKERQQSLYLSYYRYSMHIIIMVLGALYNDKTTKPGN